MESSVWRRWGRISEMNTDRHTSVGRRWGRISEMNVDRHTSAWWRWGRIGEMNADRHTSVGRRSHICVNYSKHLKQLTRSIWQTMVISIITVVPLHQQTTSVGSLHTNILKWIVLNKDIYIHSYHTEAVVGISLRLDLVYFTKINLQFYMFNTNRNKL